MGCLSVIFFIFGVLSLIGVIPGLLAGIFPGIIAFLFAAMWFALSHVCGKASSNEKKQNTLLTQQNQLLSDQILAQSDPTAYKALVAKREQDAKIAKEAQAKQTKAAAICACVLAAILGIGVLAVWDNC